MSIERLNRCATNLASSVGPLRTLEALWDFEGALAELDRVIDMAALDEEVIDLRALRCTLDNLEPVLARADVRIDHLRSVLMGR